MEEDAIRSAAIHMNLELVPDSNDWMGQLAAAVNHLLVNDFNKLIAILYRLDVSEPVLRGRLASEPRSDAGLLIAGMMVDRQAQKIKSREQSRRDNDDLINSEDRW